MVGRWYRTFLASILDSMVSSYELRKLVLVLGHARVLNRSLMAFTAFQELLSSACCWRNIVLQLLGVEDNHHGPISRISRSVELQPQLLKMPQGLGRRHLCAQHPAVHPEAYNQAVSYGAKRRLQRQCKLGHARFSCMLEQSLPSERTL